MGRYVSTFTFDHNENLTCVFRNWKSTADNLKYLHGYSLSVKVIFESFLLDPNNQNVNSSFIDKIKNYLIENFYYTTIIANDDPALPQLIELDKQGVVRLKIWTDVSIEKISEIIYFAIIDMIAEEKIERFILKTVEVREHQGSSSVFIQ